jgi:hypothetical protein
MGKGKTVFATKTSSGKPKEGIRIAPRASQLPHVVFVPFHSQRYRETAHFAS